MNTDTRKLKRMHHKLCYIKVVEKDKNDNDIEIKKRINNTSLKVFARSLDGHSKDWFNRKRITGYAL